MPATRLASLLTCLALCLACTAATPRSVTTCLAAPACPRLELALRDSARGTTWTLTTDPQRVGAGVLRWFDGLGELEGTTTLDLNPDGQARGRAPAFATTWQTTFELTGDAAVPTFLIAGGPLRPALGPGTPNLVYLLRIVAPDRGRAIELATPITTGRTDAPPRAAVEVLLHLAGHRAQGNPGDLVLRISGTTEPPDARVHLDGAALVAHGGAPLAWERHGLHGWRRLEAAVPTSRLVSDRDVRLLEVQTGSGPGTLTSASIELDLTEPPGSGARRAAPPGAP